MIKFKENSYKRNINRISYANKYLLRLLLMGGCIGYSLTGNADDSEIFFSKPTKESAKPNVLIVIDSSKMSRDNISGTNTPRMTVLKQAVEKTFRDPANQNLRLGVMHSTFSIGLNIAEGNDIAEVSKLNEIDSGQNPTITSASADYKNLLYKITNNKNDGWESQSPTGYPHSASPIYNSWQRSSMPNTEPNVYPQDYIHTPRIRWNKNAQADNRETVGLRFPNILVKNTSETNLSANQTIQKAELELYSAKAETSYLHIWIDADDDAPYLDTTPRFLHTRVAKARALGSNNYRKSVYISTPARGRFSIDVTDLIKIKISQPGWKEGNAINFYIRTEAVHTGHENRDISFAFNLSEKGSGNEPRLKITVNNKAVTENKKTYFETFLTELYNIEPDNKYFLENKIYLPMMYASMKISNIKKQSGTGPYSPLSITPAVLEGCQLSHIVLVDTGKVPLVHSEHYQYMVKYMNKPLDQMKIYTSHDKSSTIDDYYQTERDAELGIRPFASWLARTNHSNFPGGNYVKIHTVGIDVPDQASRNFLQDIAEHGMGKYREIKGPENLVDALADIVVDALVLEGLSSSGKVNVSTQTRYKQRSEVFYSLFKSELYDYWSGNVKGFKLKHVVTKLSNGSKAERAILVDKNNKPAMDSTGVITLTASSLWANSNKDGGRIDKGGVVGMLKAPAERNMFTLIKQGSNISLAEPITAESTKISNADLALTGDDQTNVRKGLLGFIRGYRYQPGGSTEAVKVKKIGDATNTGVSFATYGCGTGKDLLECGFDNLSQVAMLASNDGFVRGYDTKTGVALYEYMPKEMLPILQKLQDRKPLTLSNIRTYGLDGKITIYHDDENGDSYINNGEDAFAYVISGRGGSLLYALDISDRTEPKLAWMISKETSGFEKLGDMWSVPAVGKIKIGQTITPVLIFGGGYDKTQDDKPARKTDDVGNALYIVNARDGELLRTITTNMHYSIPSPVAILTNQDELDNQPDPNDPNDPPAMLPNNNALITDFFVGDMGGQLWRFRVNNGNVGNDLISPAGINGGVIARFAGDNVRDSRRFYHAPAITTFKTQELEGLISLTIGSGYKAHPLSDDISDRIYSLRLPRTADGNEKVITEADLAVTAADGKSLEEGQNSHNGFMIKLSTGEKVISDGFADFGRLVFNTYIPSKAVVKNCVPGSGTQRTYNYDIATGESLLTGAYAETSVAALPPDVTAYCSNKFCTIVPAPEYLSEGTDIEDAFIVSLNGQGVWQKVGWTDFFDLNVH